MLLRNFYNMMAICVVGGEMPADSTFGDGHLTKKDLDGNVYRLRSNSGAWKGICLSYIQGLNGSSFTSTGFRLGSSSAAVTYDDYTVSEISNLVINNISHGVPTYNNGVWSNTLTATITNNNSFSVTINEVGIDTATPANDYQYLIYREVLSTPFTIAAGESVTYTHNFEFTMPTIS